MESIGQLIKEELERQERSVAWFARKLCLDRSNVYRLFQRNTIDTGLLARISIILDRNFFTVLSEQVAERQNMQQ
ncbi:MAG: XRE family transcriptional regulator [Muribaculaceae bacterium]